jgi:hypothetical protein
MEELTTKLEAFHNNPDERNQKEAAMVEDLNRFFAAHNKTPDSSRSSFTETAPSPDFVAQFGWATRAAFVAALLGTLRAPDVSPAGTSSHLFYILFLFFHFTHISVSCVVCRVSCVVCHTVCAAVLRVFKLCTREAQHAEDFAQPEVCPPHTTHNTHAPPHTTHSTRNSPGQFAHQVLELMLAHTNLGVDDHVEDVDGASSRQRHPVAVAAEALRCIVNLVHHSPAALAPRLYATVGMRPFLRALEREPDPTYRLSLLRLVFNCSLEKVPSRACRVVCRVCRAVCVCVVCVVCCVAWS